ncbi:hypothetical protein ACO2Q2_15710 [Dyella sp. KRB-257]|uniref:hypothetical protein n=1 Tax=Dyella sp. KRB-257 TaxID=3400915 RepID=UPI003BFF7EE5
MLIGLVQPTAMPASGRWLFDAPIHCVMLRNAGLLDLWGDALALIVFTAVMMCGAILRLRKRLD